MREYTPCCYTYIIPKNKYLKDITFKCFEYMSDDEFYNVRIGVKYAGNYNRMITYYYSIYDIILLEKLQSFYSANTGTNTNVNLQYAGKREIPLKIFTGCAKSGCAKNGCANSALFSTNDMYIEILMHQNRSRVNAKNM